MKRFVLVGSKYRPKSTIYTYKKSDRNPPILVRVRKRDGLCSEVAWSEKLLAMGNLTHDAVHDGFVPVNGNSMYENRFLNMRLLVGYTYADSTAIPCVIRSMEYNGQSQLRIDNHKSNHPL